MHRECLLGTRFLDRPQSVVTHSILTCIVVILQYVRICHTSHAVGMHVIQFQCQLSIHFCDGYVHTHSNMCCDTPPCACTKHGDASSVSLMATHFCGRHLHNLVTSRLIPSTHASFFSRDGCVFAMLSHVIVVVTTD